MVLAEAMAAGIPVVALDASGVREVVKDGWNGRLLPVDADSKEFCTAIQEWLATASVDESWREAVNRTAALFSEDNCLLRMEALYRDLIQQHPVANPMTVWEKLAASFEAEWELAAEKARAASTALTRK
jgi:glycosyltransferase involved in cell wall biosynthesis